MVTLIDAASSPTAPPTAQKKGSESDSFRRRRLTLTDLDPAELIKDIDSKSASPTKTRVRSRHHSPEMGKIVDGRDLLFPLELCGTYSCHGIEPGRHPGMPNGKINQDRGIMSFPFAGQSDAAVFGVFDGHGSGGEYCSGFASQVILSILEDDPSLFDEPHRALKHAFTRADALMHSSRSVDSDFAGTTAVVVIVHGNELIAGNAGDSRAVLARRSPGGKALRALELTTDHKADSPAEHKRILARGGYVAPAEADGCPARVYIDAEMTYPGLAMSRSIGDHIVSPIGIVADPDVTRTKITADDEFLILASDGVWEFLSSDEAVHIVASHMHKGATYACKKLIEQAADLWQIEEGDYRDDITAVVAVLPGLLQGESHVPNPPPPA